MPSLFHRRTRSASAQRPQTPVSSNAHVAATQAFLANRAPSGNLSASAAATALRTMSPPPTPVSEIQTKRMQRRSSSASLSNAPRGRSRGGLERQTSSGSMTERTFRRSPSPGRPDLAAPVHDLPEDIPPVPKVPKRSSRRAASLDTPPTRVVSPPADGPVSQQQAPRPAGPSKAKPSSVERPLSPQQQQQQQQQRPNGPERTDSRNSINFSYPRPQSPPAQSPATPKTNVRPARNGMQPAEAERVQYGVAAAATQPVKKKKKKAAPRSTEGSHLQARTMASHPVETPLPPGPDTPPQAQQQPVKKKKQRAALSGQSSHFPAHSESDSDSTPEQERRAKRASGMLNKQPSVVREDWEGEQEQEASQAQQLEEQGLSPITAPDSVVQSKKPQPAANMSRKIEEPATSPKPAEASIAPGQHVPTGQAESRAPSSQYLTVDESQPRTSSLSPSRSTRFSDRLASDLASGKKHEPLPRSVSPVKSAMKHHSPSPHGRDQRLPAPRGSSATPSDASDSNMSAEGSVRRRKSARVSFEPSPEIVGVAAEKPDDASSPVLVSPQNRDQGKKGFFGIGRSKPALSTIPSEDTLDEHMKPRPQLPSFGSIRGRGRRPDDADGPEAPQTPKDVPSSSGSSTSLGAGAGGQGASSDHAVGAILAQDASKRAAETAPAPDPNLPLPPEVTSVEGSGYLSDTDTDISDAEGPTTDALATSAPSGPATTARSPIDEGASPMPPTQAEKAASPTPPAQVSEPANVPDVAVQPPTPGPESQNSVDQWLVDVPGGFPGEDAANVVTDDSEAQQAVRTPAPPPETPTATRKSLEKAPAAQVEESSSDNDSIYSDAAEDQSELEGTGFGSINAIVESPMVESPMHRITTPPESPLAQSFPRRPQDPTRTTSWDATQQRWSGIAQQTRQASAEQMPQERPQEMPQPQPQPQPVAPERQAPQLEAPKPKKKKQTKPAALAAASAPAAAVRGPPPQVRNQPSAHSTIQQRSKQRQVSGPMPSSMRAGEPTTAGRGLQASKWAAAETRPRSPPQAPPAPASPPRAALQKKHIPPASGSAARRASQPTLRPAPKPQPVDDDSDSSFRKARRRKAPDDGVYTMRRSMRAGPSPQDAPRQPAGRGGVRSLSPPPRRPFTSGGETRQFRTSMRGSVDRGAPTLRGEAEAKRSSPLFGRGKKSPSPARPTPLPLTTGLRTRIGDSDDEDEPRRTKYKSRFAEDSDDEPDAAPLRPVRGIPKRQDDGDSTDLEDSSDEEKKRQPATTKPSIKVDTSSQRPATSAGVPTSPTATKKKGLFARFRGKKDKDARQDSSPAIDSASPKDKEEDGELGNLGFASTAERDAVVQQTLARLEAVKKSEDTTAPQGPPQDAAEGPTDAAAGRLQRRSTPQRLMSDSWPLPAKAGDEEDRPNSSDAVGAKPNGLGARPGIGSRRETGDSQHTEGGGVAYGRSGKKKRFPMLRKAFRLKD